MLIAVPSSLKEASWVPLRHPRVYKKAVSTDDEICWFLIAPDSSLYELLRISAGKRSSILWSQKTLLKDDSIVVATPLEIVFLWLPIVRALRHKENNGKGNFHTFEELMEKLEAANATNSEASDAVEHLFRDKKFGRLAEQALESICDTMLAGEIMLFRQSDIKTFSLIDRKVAKVSQNLPESIYRQFIDRQLLPVPEPIAYCSPETISDRIESEPPRIDLADGSTKAEQGGNKNQKTCTKTTYINSVEGSSNDGSSTEINDEGNGRDSLCSTAQPALREHVNCAAPLLTEMIIDDEDHPKKLTRNNVAGNNENIPRQILEMASERCAIDLVASYLDSELEHDYRLTKSELDGYLAKVLAMRRSQQAARDAAASYMNPTSNAAGSKRSAADHPTSARKKANGTLKKIADTRNMPLLTSFFKKKIEQ